MRKQAEGHDPDPQPQMFVHFMLNKKTADTELMLLCAIFVSFTVSQTDVQHQVKVKIKKFSFHAAKKKNASLRLNSHRSGQILRR